MRHGHTIYRTGNVRVERFSFLTAFVRRRSEAVLPPWRCSFQQSRQLRSRLSPPGTFGSKEAFICGSGNLFVNIAFMVVACVSVRKTA